MVTLKEIYMSSFITMQLQQIWDKTLDLIKENSKVDTANFSVWFDGSQLFDIRDDLAIITVPYKVNKQIISDLYKDLIK